MEHATQRRSATAPMSGTADSTAAYGVKANTGISAVVSEGTRSTPASRVIDQTEQTASSADVDSRSAARRDSGKRVRAGVPLRSAVLVSTDTASP
jgi:hypothetical protein